MSYRHISGWVNVTGPEGPEGPIDPGWGNYPPTDPGYGRPGWSPADPGYGLGAGLRPGNDLPWAPGHPGNKPPGRPIIPPHPGNKPPNGGRPPHPWLPGHWEPVDPGWGKPPLWGWIPAPDNGLPEPPPDPVTKPTPPGQGGVWAPTDPDYGKPVRPCPPAGGIPHPPIWAWIPDRPDIPVEGSITFYPSGTVTVLASGGSGSVNISGGAWTVDPASVPGWVTITPMSGDESKNLTYSAAQNTTGLPRQALVKVSGATFTINQGAV